MEIIALGRQLRFVISLFVYIDTFAFAHICFVYSYGVLASACCLPGLLRDLVLGFRESLGSTGAFSLKAGLLTYLYIQKAMRRKVDGVVVPRLQRCYLPHPFTITAN